MSPLTPERWPALEDLFGKAGASNGCWCMYWRLGPGYRNRPCEDNKVPGSGVAQILASRSSCGGEPGAAGRGHGGVRDWALVTVLTACSADGAARAGCSRYPDPPQAQPAPRGHTLAAVIGEAGVRRARRYLHRAEADLTVAMASLGDADLTATARDELAGLGTELLHKAQILTGMLPAGRGDPRPGDGLTRALDRENAALRRAVRQVLLAMDAGQITNLEAAHLIADAVDLHRRNLRLLMQALEADQQPDAGDPASR